MLTILLLMVGGATTVVLVLLAVVVIGIKQERSAEELPSRPPNSTTAWVRHLLGVYVRKPNRPLADDGDQREPCLTTWEPPRWPEGPAE